MLGATLANPHPYCGHPRGNVWYAQHYRTYNAYTGTFTGYDGYQHPCP